MGPAHVDKDVGEILGQGRQYVLVGIPYMKISKSTSGTQEQVGQ